MDKAAELGFFEWLTHHGAVTGHDAPPAESKGLEAIARSYCARVREGYSLEKLKAATIGAHSDDWRRDNGYDTPTSILKPTKIPALVAQGERVVREKGETQEEGADPRIDYEGDKELRAMAARARERGDEDIARDFESNLSTNYLDE